MSAPKAPVIFKGWQSSTPDKASAAEQRQDDALQKETDAVRHELHRIREQGRLQRLQRLEALDALETKRMTLLEIFKRMELELHERDVHSYGDVLAETFGTRKIYAHRAIGLEALLCQFMHQMLAKQHQLKLLKQGGKSLQAHYRQSKRTNREEFHSYEALTVQLEASRLSLEALYDDLFAAQHTLLAQLKHVEAGGKWEEVSTTKPDDGGRTKVALRNAPSDKQQHRRSLSGDGSNIFGEDEEDKNDLETAMDLLTVNTSPDGTANGNETTSSSKTAGSKENNEPTAENKGNKSARERRREIEHLRQARVIKGGGISPRLSNASNDSGGEGDVSPESTRARMRALEEQARKSLENSNSVGMELPEEGNDLEESGNKDKSSSSSSSKTTECPEASQSIKP